MRATTTISINSNLRIPVDTNSSILSLYGGGDIRLRIESEYPIDVYVVDGEGLADFSAARGFNTLWKARGIQNLVQRVHARPRKGMTYVILLNQGPNPTAVHYEVSP